MTETSTYEPGKKRLITINGVTKYVAEWCRHYGIRSTTVWGRVNHRGMTYEQALTTPIAWKVTERNYKALVPSDYDTLATCLKIACEGTEFTPKTLLQSKNLRDTSHARRLAWRELRERGWLYSKIAKAFDMNHTSIIYGLHQLGVVGNLREEIAQRKASEKKQKWAAVMARRIEREQLAQEKAKPKTKDPDALFAELMAGHALPVNVNAPVKYRFQEELEARFI